MGKKRRKPDLEEGEASIYFKPINFPSPKPIHIRSSIKNLDKLFRQLMGDQYGK